MSSRVEAGLVDLLINDATFLGLVADLPQPMRLVQNPTYPSVTYQRIDAQRVKSTEGPSCLADARVQFDVWATTWNEARQIADAIRVKLDGFVGTATAQFSPTEAFKIQGIFIRSERDLYDGETELYRISQDYDVWYTET